CHRLDSADLRDLVRYIAGPAHTRLKPRLIDHRYGRCCWRRRYRHTVRRGFAARRYPPRTCRDHHDHADGVRYLDPRGAVRLHLSDRIRQPQCVLSRYSILRRRHDRDPIDCGWSLRLCRYDPDCRTDYWLFTTGTAI